MAIGHSEGTITVAGLSAKFAAITHTVLLSGGGPTQLFDLAELARKTSNSKNLVEAQKEVDEVFLQWDKISKDPDSIEKFAWGHPFKR